MKVLVVILGVIFVGIIGLLCLFCCIISSRADEYWEELRSEFEKRNEGR